jgi:hypothetical protein
LSCTPVSSCTSVPGQSLTCDGTVTQCTYADAWCVCQDECSFHCEYTCDHFGHPACGFCINYCMSTNCGSTPANTTCNL